MSKKKYVKFWLRMIQELNARIGLLHSEMKWSNEHLGRIQEGMMDEYQKYDEMIPYCEKRILKHIR